MKKIRIYADFNHGTTDENCLLDVPGAIADINQHDFKGHQNVILYDEELEIDATLKFDGVWIGIINPNSRFRKNAQK